MLLTITLTRSPAIDLSYLLHKHPDRLQEAEIKGGRIHIFYPEVTDDRCTCAILMELDPVALVRSDTPGSNTFALEQYVNDRPYVASSFLTSALSKAFRSAMNGLCKDRPELVDVPLPLEAMLSVVQVRGGEDLLQRLFFPLGYEISCTRHELDNRFPEWGMSRYCTVRLKHTVCLKDLLSHLYVLLPVLDNDKHYWVSNEEIAKLLEKGKGWLESHPEKELIATRYLRHQRSLAREAMGMLMKDELPEEELAEDPKEEAPAKIRLHDLRLKTVCEALLQTGAQSVLDLGCGEGKLLRLLMKEKQFTKITGMDVVQRSLEIAAGKLKLDRLPEKQKERISLIQGSLTYRDKRLEGFDAAALVEVIEHLDEERLKALEKVVFALAVPGHVVLTTPNKEWNTTFTDDADKMRHSDHRFEWTRAEFETWCAQIGEQYPYDYTIQALGEETEGIGAASQMVLFTRRTGAQM